LSNGRAIPQPGRPTRPIRIGGSRTGLWPIAADEGASIEGIFRGTRPSVPGRPPWLVFEDTAGGLRTVQLTRSLRPVARRLAIGGRYRATFTRLRWASGRWLRVITIDLIP
jgi:hypothetical protein